MITDVFLDPNRLNICEHMVKTAPCESFKKVPPAGVQDSKGRKRGGDGGKIEWKSCEVNARTGYREQNKFIGQFNMAMSDVISIKG